MEDRATISIDDAFGRIRKKENSNDSEEACCVGQPRDRRGYTYTFVNILRETGTTEACYSDGDPVFSSFLLLRETAKRSLDRTTPHRLPRVNAPYHGNDTVPLINARVISTVSAFIKF